MLEVNSVFSEALAQAKCAHPNVCDFIDFRLYQGKSGHYCAYRVIYRDGIARANSAMEIQERKLQPYDEVELMDILQQVIAALLNAKHQDLAHRDIMPLSILRGPQGLKLADFRSTWLKRLYSRTSSAIGTEMYISPEAWEVRGNQETQQQLFESDIFALGMTMLHLAATELPKRTPAMSRSKLQALLQRKVQALRYSEELKRLLTAMLSTATDRHSRLSRWTLNASIDERLRRRKFSG